MSAVMNGVVVDGQRNNGYQTFRSWWLSKEDAYLVLVSIGIFITGFWVVMEFIGVISKIEYLLQLNGLDYLGSLENKLWLEGREAHGLGAFTLSPVILEIESCSILMRH
uniref:Uncharacterized protein n=1 Tax=Nelumbo nucifera TaxID=4432 RepID=A0A822YY01_NELNU|nr:TPA_asm: hypothetical protein HUJ06_007724 [Nelumbo nucifera]